MDIPEGSRMLLNRLREEEEPLEDEVEAIPKCGGGGRFLTEKDKTFPYSLSQVDVLT